MALSLRGSALWLALITACSGEMFNASEQGAGGQAGVSGSKVVGGRDGRGGTHDSDIEGGAASQAGASDEPVSGGAGTGTEAGGAGGQGGSGDAVCEVVCGDEEQCVATPKGGECRCAGALVRDAEKCRLPRSCDELHGYAPSLPSGPYPLKPEGAASSFQGYCGMTQEGGGWTLVVNDGPTFDPTTNGVADALCYSSRCTSIGYSLVPLESDVMIDISNSPIAGTTYAARLIVNVVHAMSRGKTLRTLFTTGPNYVEAENNSNLAVRMRDGVDCSTLPADMAKVACESCDTAGCKVPVIVFGDVDSDPACRAEAVPHFAIGAAYDYVTPWKNCAGWPQAPDYGARDFYPDHFRVWVR